MEVWSLGFRKNFILSVPKRIISRGTFPFKTNKVFYFNLFLSPQKTLSVFGCVCEAQQEDEAQNQEPPSAPIRRAFIFLASFGLH